VLQARWDWVDWDRNSIILSDSKTGPKPLYLSNPALVVLRDLSTRPEAATSTFIIKGRLAGRCHARGASVRNEDGRPRGGSKLSWRISFLCEKG